MTSVFRDKETNEIIVMCKGADSVLLPLLKDQETTQVTQLTTTTTSFMDKFAQEGLRTLLFVEKTMSKEDYDMWNTDYQMALSSIVDRDAKVDKCAEALERGFELIGSTALEDKLQDGVPDTINMIRQAGIKLWVLTGDKIETAINIGYACHLLDDSINQYLIDGARSADVYKQICIAENK